MNTNEKLFPHRLDRRDFLKMTCAAAAGLAIGTPARAAERTAPGRIGSGHFSYELVEGWGDLPAGMSFGLGCGVVVDARDRVFVTTRSTNPCVAIFAREGKLLETWSSDFGGKVGLTTQQVKDTAHCLYWSQEGRDEFIYWTENVAGGKDGKPKIGARVYKTDLQGKVLYEIGNVAKDSSTTQKFDWTNPTDVAVAPNGDIYVVDGYGSQRVTRFDKNWKPLRTIGGTGTENGQFKTCHGVWVKVIKGRDPEVYIADRHNDRLQVFDLELNHKRTLKGDVRNPCCFYQHEDHIYVPDLASRLTIFDADDKLVTHLGDGKGIPNGSMGVKKELADQHPDKFFGPHAMAVDSRGDLYVVEWVSFGRVRKFKHTPQKP